MKTSRRRLFGLVGALAAVAAVPAAPTLAMPAEAEPHRPLATGESIGFNQPTYVPGEYGCVGLSVSGDAGFRHGLIFTESAPMLATSEPAPDDTLTLTRSGNVVLVKDAAGARVYLQAGSTVVATVSPAQLDSLTALIAASRAESEGRG